jgi:aminopeptidase N
VRASATFATLTALVLAPAPAPEVRPYRERAFHVADYEAELAVDATARTVQGWARLRVVSRAAALAAVDLDAGALTIDEIRDGDTPVRFEQRPGLLHIPLAAPLPQGQERRITVSYAAPSPRGIRFHPAGWFTVFHTEGWLPCNASPGDRSTATFHWIVPAGETLVGTGEEVARRPLPGGRERRTWQLRRPYPAYLLGAAAGRLQTRCRPASPVELCASTAGELDAVTPALDAAAALLGPLASWAGVPFPLARYHQVFVPGPAAQELVGMAVMREAFLKDEAAEPREDWLVVHELIHTWWGNLVTCRTWGDYWLNEGITTFIEAAARERRWGRAEYEQDLALARRRYHRARQAGQDRPLSSDDWTRPGEGASAIPYSKGALVMHLLRERLGEGPFWAGLRAFTTSGAGRPVTSADLRRAFERASGQELGPLFAAWVTGHDVPVLRATHRRQGRSLVVIVEQRPDAPPAPLTVAVETAQGRLRQRLVLRQGRAEARFAIGDADPLSVRVDERSATPTRVEHDRPRAMLLYQLAHEPDLVGRLEALEQLTRGCQGRDCRDLIPALLARATHEPARLIARELRQAAEALRSPGRDGGAPG